MVEPVIPLGELIARRLDKHIVEPFIEFLRRRSPTTRHALWLLATALLVASAVWAVWSLHTYSRLLAPTFARRLETNDNPYKGVEAFLLSAVEGEPRGYWGPGIDADTLQCMIDSLEHSPTVPALIVERGWQHRRLRENTPDRVTSLWDEKEGFSRSKDSTDTVFDWSKYNLTLMQKDPDIYFFLPAIFLGFSDCRKVDIDSLDSLRIRKVLCAPDSSPQGLGREVAAAYAARHILKMMDHHSIDGLEIIQSYFFGDRGTIAIRDNRRATGSGYAGQFGTTRYFAARPYFYLAGEEEHRRGFFDYVMEPYIDYAGRGVMRTYTKVVRLANGHKAVLAFDCAIPDGEQRLMDRAKDLQAPWRKVREYFEPESKKERVDFSLGLGQGSTRLQFEGEPPEWFRKQLEDAIGTGTIARFIGQITARPQPEGESSYEFVVPISGDPGGSRGMNWTHCIAVRINLNDMRRAWLSGALCILLTFFFGGFTYYFYHEHVAERREQEKVLHNVTTVMHHAVTPFAWFDSQNRFVDANQSMADWLGYQDVEDLKQTPNGEKRMFRDLLVEWDREAYHERLRKSAEGHPSEAYWCTVKRADGIKLRILVHGERMPLEFQRGDQGPHRFGVFLRWRHRGKTGRTTPKLDKSDREDGGTKRPWG